MGSSITFFFCEIWRVISTCFSLVIKNIDSANCMQDVTRTKNYWLKYSKQPTRMEFMTLHTPVGCSK